MLTLNCLFHNAGVDPKQVLVFRHRPWEAKLNKCFDMLAVERPDLFNTYQQFQGERVEKAMKGAKFVASFIGHQPGKAMFVGLYSVEGFKPITKKQFWEVPGNRELRDDYGMCGFTDDSARPMVLQFDLRSTPHFADWSGKLVVHWPGKELSWWRWADRNDFRVHAIHEEKEFDAAMPSWDELVIPWQKLRVLSDRWRSALQQWRGIYYIFDDSDGRGYVGSAYGAQNIYARWISYASTGHGGNRLLRKRNPKSFLFSILQRVSPDMEAEDVIRIENSWKRRLHTMSEEGGLNCN